MASTPQSNSNNGKDKISASCRPNQLFLPEDYQPSNNDVIIGRGKKCYNHEGNIKLRCIVASRIEEYAAATTKREKSQVLSVVITQIRTGNPNGKFIRKHAETKFWFDIGDELAKEKVSQTFRDALGDFYNFGNNVAKKRIRERRDEKAPLRKRSRLQSSSRTVDKNQIQPFIESSSDSKITCNTVACNLDSPLHTMLFYDDPLEPTPISQMLKFCKVPQNEVDQMDHRVRIDNSGNTQNFHYDTDTLDEIDTSDLSFFNENLKCYKTESCFSDFEISTDSNDLKLPVHLQHFRNNTLLPRAA